MGSQKKGLGIGIRGPFGPMIGAHWPNLGPLVPNLELFNIQAAISAGVDVPFAYLGWAFSYCAVYSFIAMLLALIMFEDRDLA